MRFTKYFLPILKEIPADAQIKSHQLMLRAGMIKQTLMLVFIQPILIAPERKI